MIKLSQLFLFSTFVLLVSCNLPSNEDDSPRKEGFVYLEGKEFMLDGEKFFPIMMNYMFDMREMDGEIFFGPSNSYDSLYIYEGKTKIEIQERLRVHFQLIKELGFNTIRLVGAISESYTDETGELLISTIDESENKNYEAFKGNEIKWFNSMHELISIIDEFELKVMFLFPKPMANMNFNVNRLEFVEEVLIHFKENTTIFSYDFFNEPIYFDKSELKDGEDKRRSKQEAYEIVNAWKELIDERAPYHLMTIGFSEPLEVFEWDPSILPVDFVSFHTYNPLRVPNEIYWWSKYVNKPWMVGETSLPADNDSISYIEQRQFLIESFKRTVDCGGAGFGWWQFQDVHWGDNYEHNYTALLNHDGITRLKDTSKVIYGGIKPAALELKNILLYKGSGKCDCMNNYFNMIGYHNIKINGRIIDESGKPIEGAVIRGWTIWWGIGANTFTDKNGEFNLYSNDEFVHFEISAPGMTKIKFDHRVNYNNKDKEASMFQTLQNKEWEYHNIHYKWFLKNNDTDSIVENEPYVFNFKENAFNQYQFYGSLGTRMLKTLDFVKK